MDESLFLPSCLLLFRAQLNLPLKIQYPGGEDVFCCFQVSLATFHSDLHLIIQKLQVKMTDDKKQSKNN